MHPACTSHGSPPHGLARGAPEAQPAGPYVQLPYASLRLARLCLPQLYSCTPLVRDLRKSAHHAPASPDAHPPPAAVRLHLVRTRRASHRPRIPRALHLALPNALLRGRLLHLTRIYARRLLTCFALGGWLLTSLGLCRSTFIAIGTARWGIKSTVILITVLEVRQSSLLFSATSALLIDGFDSLDGLGPITWQALTQLLSSEEAAYLVGYSLHLNHNFRSIEGPHSPAKRPHL
ncbi:hypothetical protein FB451DRAFT_1536687 [Mycena latifolia]|nr:hypothetical protein FB451DRAFT_1536687 [Mycena latifolia]